MLGAHRSDNGQFFVPQNITVEPQSQVIWKNEDIENHIIASANDATPENNFPDPMPDGWFGTMPILPNSDSGPITMPFRPGEYSLVMEMGIQ
jgi:plastocyanin